MCLGSCHCGWAMLMSMTNWNTVRRGPGTGEGGRRERGGSRGAESVRHFLLITDAYMCKPCTGTVSAEDGSNQPVLLANYIEAG